MDLQLSNNLEGLERAGRSSQVIQEEQGPILGNRLEVVVGPGVTEGLEPDLKEAEVSTELVTRGVDGGALQQFGGPGEGWEK